MLNVEQTILSQFANSPTICQLIQNMNEYIDPRADIDAFYENIWNIDTAIGKGLDIWGKIVGLQNGRYVKLQDTDLNLGFGEAGTLSATTFGSGTMFSGSFETTNYALEDGPFRTLILVKAMANISDGSIPGYNQLLQNLFSGRGRCYVSDLGNMQMRYTFEFYLEPYELAILQQSGVLPRPTGVQSSLIQVIPSQTFGFSEAGEYQPFGHGPFFSGTSHINLPVSGGYLDVSFILNQSTLS